MLAKMTPLFALLVLGACGLPEPKMCAVERPSKDPKIETPIWEPAPCPVALVRAVRENDGGKGFTPPTPPDVKPDPEPDPDPCKGKCSNPEPKPDHGCKGGKCGDSNGGGSKDHSRDDNSRDDNSDDRNDD